jgi:glucokinase
MTVSEYCFGIDVGGTSVKCGLFRTDGTLVEKWEIPTRSENGGMNILPDIAETIRAKTEEKEIPKKDIRGIGIGIPGPVRNGVASVAVNLHWGETKVEEILSGLTGIPVRVGNDADVAALGEMWKGGGQGRKNLIVVTLGTGIGGGIIVDGRIVEGAHGAGGEIGHAHVDDRIKDPCNCGNCGCLEQVASATGIVRLANEEMKKHPEIDSELQPEEALTARRVFGAYKNGDPLADIIVNRFAKYLGTALAAFAGVTDPEAIIIGGGVSKAGQPLIDVVSRYYRAVAFTGCSNTPLVLAKLGNDAGIYGSAYLVSGEAQS